MPCHKKSIYHFTVEWGGTRMNFIEVSGLSITVDVSELRDGANPNQIAVKLPGHIHYNNVILKREIIKGDNDFFIWMNTITSNQVQRRDVVIKLADENGEAVMNWRAVKAFPVKFSGPLLNAQGNDVVMEELELTHEGLFAEVV